MLDLLAKNMCDMKCYALRIKPGQELVSSLKKFVHEKQLKSAFIVTAVGSLTKARLRMANSVSVNDYEGFLEIVSLVGTLSDDGHLHMSLSDTEGKVVGGHVFGDLIVYTTVEVVIGECQGLTFTREFDEKTGFKELVVKDCRE
ncbi:bifunctional protein GlmU isoform X1 [Octopus bimaculoides]|uniref:PPC domain-containing protein n=1 Tax=Octopus bimaculoides TaxID=37653 RepID=A0A0L8FSS7_OCTBM|nr:bifunctional protein GlmU isoform X1 [Octopus bimaculoides]|eukprot:XP_014787261.1 PREDICTED: bifunctional protein GlmU-like isoform X1 [Octopus bimaculoides]